MRHDLHQRGSHRLQVGHGAAGSKLFDRARIEGVGRGGRIGGAPLRDVALLDWCVALIGDVLAPIPAGR